MRHAPSLPTLLLTLLTGALVGAGVQRAATERRLARETDDLLSVLPRPPEPVRRGPVPRAALTPTSPGGIVREEPDVLLHDALGRTLPGWLETEPAGPRQVADIVYRDTGPAGPQFKTILGVPRHQPGQAAPFWYDTRPGEATRSALRPVTA